MKSDSSFVRLSRYASLTAVCASTGWLCACSTPAYVVSSAGDTAAGAVKGAGRTAASATRAAGKTAASAVGTAGKVVHSSVNAAGHVAKAAVEAGADIATAPCVIFKDIKTGKASRVPWREGMTLASAIGEAGISADLDAVSVLRKGRKVRPETSFVLKPGDVIELAAKAGVPALVTAGAL